MTDWKDSIYALARVLENPRAKKGYADLRNYYIGIGRKDYADAFDYLMEKRFGPDDTPSGEEQRGDD